MATEPGLRIDRLQIGFPTPDGGWFDIVDGVSLTVGEGERVGLVGESGSGKTLTALACLGLVPEPGQWSGGSVKVAGAEVSSMSEAGLQRLRGGEIGLVLQEAAESLNPVYTVGFQLAEAIAVHRGLGREQAAQEALLLLKEAALGAPSEAAKAYPHELSGGQAQRVMLALSLAGNPRTLIADEPTSALDSLTQAEVIDLLNRLVMERQMGLLLISHDLAVVESIVDRVVVLFAGRVIEEGSTAELFSSPLHPYTRDLFVSIPGRQRTARNEAVRQPAIGHATNQKGCRYVNRCELAREPCWNEEPDLSELGGGRRVRCPVVLSDRLGSRSDD